MNAGANGTHNKNIPSPFHKSYLVISEASNAEFISGFLYSASVKYEKHIKYGQIEA